MAEEANRKPAKEEDDEDVLIAASISSAVKREEPKVGGNGDDEDDDHIPLAQNRANKKKPTNPNKGNTMKKGEAKSNAKPSKAKNEEDDGGCDGDDFKENMNKKGVVKSNAKPSRVKKEEPKDSEEDDEEDDFKVVKKKAKKRKKEEVKKAAEGKKGKKKGSVANRKEKEKKEKKVFDLPGQKHDPPEERDPLRIFYETLYQQLPNSEMAAIWMMEWGLLPADEAKKVYANKLKNRQMKPDSPVKVVSVKKTATSSVKKVKVTNSKDSAKSLKKRTADSSDDDFISSKKNAKKQKVSS